MKLYSRSELFLGIIGIALGVAYCARCTVFGWFFGAAWGTASILHLYRAFSQKWAEKSKTAENATKAAARERFGKWATPVRYFGLWLVIIGLGLVLFDHTAGGLILLLAGLGYTLIIEFWLKDTAGL